MFYEKQNYIDGRWVGEGYERMEVTNPATGRAVGTVPRLGANEVREAVEAADRAFSDWAALTAAERSRYLRRVYRMMMEQQEELAALMTLEMGKPLKEARAR